MWIKSDPWKLDIVEGRGAISSEVYLEGKEWGAETLVYSLLRHSMSFTPFRGYVVHIGESPDGFISDDGSWVYW